MSIRWLSFLTLLGCSEDFAPVGGVGPTALASEADPSADTADPTGDTAGGTDDTAEPAAEWPVPCATWAAPEQTGTVADTALDELSGLAASWRNPGLLWVLEDHAGAASVYGLDASGATVAVVTLDGVVNNDWESLAVGPCAEGSCLFIGDTGDNDHDRPWHGLHRVPEPEVLPGSRLELTIVPTTFPYVYPDGAWDSEGMIVDPDGLPVLLSKEYDTEHTSLYRFPALDPSATATLAYLTRIATGDEGEGGAAAVTGADLWPDGSRLMVRTYGHVWELEVPGGELTRLAEATREARTTGEERQGEAISYDPETLAFVTVSEGANPPLYRVECGE